MTILINHTSKMNRLSYFSSRGTMWIKVLDLLNDKSHISFTTDRECRWPQKFHSYDLFNQNTRIVSQIFKNYVLINLDGQVIIRIILYLYYFADDLYKYTASVAVIKTWLYLLLMYLSVLSMFFLFFLFFLSVLIIMKVAVLFTAFPYNCV